ncbi:response regulator transcription factor [Mucilaginibacter arboris]|uniref:Response regulator n=1 Tax=Mucilaginibacter arboris TaxID=2682090 RepID=A0A7K1SWD4_9SPHI|nr:response regulator transcription factor [Mucilaginibacter arboris]MVN21603.1 response regulator [Mucilaginibacter arboris]
MPEKTRIVVIEDNTQIREGFAAVLESTETFIITGQYSNCEEAIKNLRDDSPEIVLMDIDLPGMSGIEGTAIIKKLMPATIVIIITVLEESEKVFQSLCAGAGGYIVKNSALEEIVKTINEALAGGAPMSLSIAKMVVSSFKQSNSSPLSERETAVLRGIAEGKTYSKIALDLFVSKETIRSHIKNIYHKLAVNSKAQALKIAGDKKWITGRNY